MIIHKLISTACENKAQNNLQACQKLFTINSSHKHLNKHLHYKINSNKLFETSLSSD